MRRHWQVLWVFLFVSLAGCGSSSGTYPVRGKVTWNDSPLAEGDMTFVPNDPTIQPQGAVIRGGTYKVNLQPGTYRVQIIASREGTKFDPIVKMTPRDQYIPEIYNQKSTLTAEVTADGPNQFDFPLKDSK